MPIGNFWDPKHPTNYDAPGGVSMYTSPFVRDYLEPTIPQGTFERQLGKFGLGGFDRRSQFARSLYGRTQSGYQGALTDNPFLSYRNYLRDSFTPDFIENLSRDLAPGQRGETPGLYGGMARTIARG